MILTCRGSEDISVIRFLLKIEGEGAKASTALPSLNSDPYGHIVSTERGLK